MRTSSLAAVVALHCSLLSLVSGSEPARILDARVYHLGTVGQPEWRQFEGKTPHGQRLEVRFTAQANAREATLFLRQDDVKLDWFVELNGRRLGKLFLMEAPLVHTLPVPPGALRDGENTLSIIPPTAVDDILVGSFALNQRPLKDALTQCTLAVEVRDRDTRADLPCRLTIVDDQGALAALWTSADQSLTARPGVVYSRDGRARIGLLSGRYTVYATRGFEYGLDQRTVSLAVGQTKTVRLRLRREVPTPGLASSDTHIHTFTLSGHGDATMDERQLTLAGEGIELPIATDHDVLADYREPAQRTRVQDRFTPVIGCEVTTAKGHFNIFPIAPGSTVPDKKIEDWPRLMQAMRATPGVQVVILNHPRNVHSGFQPFASTHFNAVTGENLRGPEFTFDAIEVCNSSALQSDWMASFRDWFALLNYGYRVTAVGSSDCHDVSRYIVGQGRSYVACDDRDPAALSVAEACRSFRDGRVLVSMGLLTQMTVDGKFGVGDLATGLRDKVKVTVTVLGPSWVSAERVELYANGVKLREQKLSPRARGGEKARFTWTIPRPAHDAWLVAFASGPPVTAPYWAIPRPYQPTSREWHPRVLGCTNPIWLDADADGRFTAPRAYAKQIVQQTGGDPAKFLSALASVHEAVAAQAASLWQASGQDARADEFVRLLQHSPERVRRGFAAFLATQSGR
ncbi:MAG: PHP domain-containing protein [Verrucomicrobia bacterium]|nr:PHP domain-containing protein [Verrucomicrobiota bacterium]